MIDENNNCGINNLGASTANPENNDNRNLRTSGIRKHKATGNHADHSATKQGRKRPIARSRRGVGAIIGGTLLALILFTSFFIYFMTMMQTQTEKGKVDVQSSILEQERKIESFEVNSATCPDPCTALPVLVNNDGPTPMNATYAVVFPVDDPADRTVTPLQLFGVNGTMQVLNPGESGIFAVPSNDDGLNVNTTKTYHIDIISSRGNLESAVWTPDDGSGSGGGGSGGGSGSGSGGGVGQNNTGTNIGSGQGSVYAGMNGTVLQFKRLAQGSGIAISETANTITITNTQGAAGVGEVNDGQVQGCALTSPLPANCANVYAGKSGVHLLFNSLKAGTGITLTSDGSGNYVIDATNLATVISATNVGAGTGHVYRDEISGVLNFRTLKGSNGIVVADTGDMVDISSSVDADLILKPQIQAIFPNPFGVASGPQPLWGAVVANPSDHPMTIRKLVISANDASLSSSRILCNNNIVAVTPASTWTCEGQGSTWNVLQWKASGSPLTIAAHDAQLFLAQTGSPVTGANNDRPSVALNYNVYTDFGQFTKVGYDFGVKGAGTHPMVNVFLSSALADKTPSNVVGVVSVQSGQSVTVRASIANYVPSTTVDANAALIIDIPKAFTAVSVTSSTGFNSPCAPTAFVDGSNQIRCTLPAGALNNAGALSSTNVKTIQFTMTAPVVTSTKEYLLYVLGDGTTDAGTFTLGPVSENVIKVTP